jgi:hypothetical protein
LTKKCRLPALFLALASTAHAEVFQYQEGMNVQLGAAWNPATPFDVAGLSSCIQHKVSSKLPNVKEAFSEQFVDNFSQLETALGASYNTSASGRFGIAKASVAATVSALRTEARSDRSVIYVVRGSRSYDPVRISSLSLSPDGAAAAAKAKASGSAGDFYRPCGTSVITSVSKASSISLVYVFKASSAAKREQIKAAVSAAVSTPKASATQALNIFSEVQRVDSEVQVNLEVMQVGASEHVATVRDLVGITPGSITEIREALKKVVAAITWESAGVVSFTADPFDKHLDVVKGDGLAQVLNAYSRIDSLRETSNRLVARYLQLRDLLSDADTGDVKLKADARPQVLSEIDQVDSQLDRLVSTARACLETPAEPCKSPFQDVSRKVLHWVDVSYGAFSTWAGEVHNNRYENVPERIRWSAKLWPVFLLTNTKYVKSAALTENGNPVAVLQSSLLASHTSNGLLSWKPLWSWSYNGDQYCFRGVWGEQCNPRYMDKPTLLSHSRTNGNAYSMTVVDIEGGVTRIPAPALPNASVQLTN